MKRLLLLSAAAALLPAQQQRDFGRAYAFAERAPESLLEQRIHELLPSIVKIHGASGVQRIEAYASGVIVSAEGHVLTLDLIMMQPGSTRVVLHDGSVHDATLLPAEPKLGVRILKIDAPGVTLQPLVLAAGEPPRNGTPVVSLGNAFRLAEFSEKLSATFGVLVARAETGLRFRLTDVEHQGELLLTDAPNNPGQLGGGLFTLRGDWIGLNARLLESTETNTQLSAAIPAAALRPYVERMLRGQLVPPEERPVDAGPPPVTGITLFDRGGRRSPPAYVERIAAGSPAAAAGLRPDDLIVRAGETPIRTCAEFDAVVARARPGERLMLTVKRRSQILQLELTLAEAR
jgi:serine protease Do